MTEWQSAMYTDLLQKNLADSSGKQMRLNNVLMQLRKCCNHPYLFEWPVDPATGNDAVDDMLIEASGKMQLLDRILVELKRQGDHQTLIFSQVCAHDVDPPASLVTAVPHASRPHSHLPHASTLTLSSPTQSHPCLRR